MTKPKLKLAISHYDRYIPLLEGVLGLDDFELEVLNVGQSQPARFGTNRHGRMLRDGEFELAEISLSSYLMARARRRPFTAIPIFPRRLFSLSQIWIKDGGAVRTPADLIGKRIGLSTFQTTLSVLAKGDLQKDFGVPWRSIEWITNKEETIAFAEGEGVKIRLAPEGANLGAMLLAGEIDAVFRPHPPRQALDPASGIRRLFTDPKAEETAYFKRNGFYPIMHVIAFRDDVLKAHPQLARAAYDMFERCYDISARYWDDPNWSRLAWGRLDIEEERRLLGANIWANGVAANRANLETFMTYSRDQGLIDDVMSVDSLFAHSTLDT